MNNTIGKVMDVYIPEQYKNNDLLDVMDRTNIAFKIMTNNNLKEVTLEQNEENATIMKNDLVEIVEQNISGKDFINIRLYGGGDYE